MKAAINALVFRQETDGVLNFIFCFAYFSFYLAEYLLIIYPIPLMKLHKILLP